MKSLLAISGSLRCASLNTMLLQAMQLIAPDEIQIELYSSLGYMPLFNPDIEHTSPASVIDLRDKIIHADGLIIASPEYAHGVSGVMKNALDWMVGNESFVNKPVMLLNASPRATIAQHALRETLLTMSARVIDAAYVAAPLLGSKLNEAAIVQHPQISLALQRGLALFVREI